MGGTIFIIKDLDYGRFNNLIINLKSERETAMKMNLLIATTAIGLIASSAAYAVTATGTATAIIRAALSALETQGMDFGILVATASPSTATLSTAGVVTTGLDKYGVPKSGVFTITGDANSQVTVSIANTTLTSTGGGSPMGLTNFTTSPTSPVTVGAGGTVGLNVGAQLAVGANQASGTYNGNYTVTLSY